MEPLLVVTVPAAPQLKSAAPRPPLRAATTFSGVGQALALAVPSIWTEPLLGLSAPAEPQLIRRRLALPFRAAAAFLGMGTGHASALAVPYMGWSLRRQPS